MAHSLNTQDKEDLNSALNRRGLRSTRQRTSVYEVILAKKDHPSADEILLRVRRVLSTISLATVYNCLETLVDCGLVRQVNLDRAPTRFCPNLTPHAHFKCSRTGKIFDLAMTPKTVSKLKSILPEGFYAENFDLSFVGSTNEPNQQTLLSTGN
jgi:Fur family peroxide stress response transcriptional regulator